MCSNNQHPRLRHTLRGAVFALMAVFAPLGQAQTLWSGTNYTFIQFQPLASDQIIQPGPGEPGVVFGRGIKGPLTGTTGSGWAFGSTNNFASLTYVSFATLRNQGAPNLAALILNKPMVVHLTNENIYFSLMFTAWGRFNTGGFTYTRATPALSAIPTVSITSPAAGAAFAAPATISLAANATVTIGTVTNVEYFAGATSLGHATASPFNVTGSIPAIGAYALTAVATATGGSSTSAVVNITVANRPTVTLTNPVQGAVFAAPAHLILSAMAAVSGGTVTNVTFYRNNNTIPFGSVTAPPFTLISGAAPAGSYAISAVAKASGLSTTSSVVTITVVTPVPTTSSSPMITNGQFSFSYTANPGLTYVVQSTSDLLTWSPGVTNVAGSNPVQYSEGVISNSWRFYRVVRLPNP